jgi:outer membrane protein
MNLLSFATFLSVFIFGYAFRIYGEQSETLTIDTCISIALKHNPQIANANGSIKTYRGGYLAARASLLPQISMQSGYTETRSSTLVQTTSLGIQAQQMLLDFGKAGKKTKGACDLWNAELANETSTRQTVAMNAEIAYIGLVSARAVQAVNNEAVKQADAHLKQTTVLYEAGAGVKFNMVKAEVDAANTRLSALKAVDGVRSAHILLELVLGVTLNDSIVLVDSLSNAVDTISLDSALSVAKKSKPELVSARLKRNAAAAQLTAAQLGRLPVITGTAGYGLFAGDPTEKWSSSWNVGANLLFPLFTGGALTGTIMQARGSLDMAQASVEALEQAVVADVENQSSLVREAVLRVSTAKKAADMAELALSLAQERYKAGSGNSLEMTDAELSLTNAKTAYVQALADCRIASARLHRAMGITRTDTASK